MKVSSPAAIPTATDIATSAASLDRKIRRTMAAPLGTVTDCWMRQKLPATFTPP
jgi:hypothetical protein